MTTVLKSYVPAGGRPSVPRYQLLYELLNDATISDAPPLTSRPAIRLAIAAGYHAGVGAPEKLR
jgi:hypothetical protein